MKVTLQEDMCEGYARCQDTAPEVFRLGPEDEHVAILMADIPAELESRVRSAVKLCPRHALEVSQEK